MAIWTIELNTYGGEIEYRCDLPDDWDEEQVYDFVLNDIEINIERDN